ncbi:MAG: hypothetical protein JNL82_35855 [Myxococcales bacterium]|nr:hypothetical protein [Myxococcales bacterium]
MRTLVLSCTCAALLACGDSGGERDSNSGPATASAPTQGSISGTATLTASASADGTGADVTGGTMGASADTGGPGDGSSPAATGDEGGLKFDVENEDTGNLSDPGATGEQGGCQKIDFLFVVDNSGSMADEQVALANSFPGFIQSIQNTVMAKDYHIMVIDTDAGNANYQMCLAFCQFFPDCLGTPCDMLPVPMGCDATLGTGLTQDPGGTPCGVAGGDRYMVDGQPNLTSTFQCLAQVGTDGDGSERPMEAMVASLSGLNKPGECNAGFLRKDAILVVTFITDEEDDQESNGNPLGWNAALVAAKYGAETSIVALGIIGDPDQPNAVCSMDQAEASPRLREFAESFTYGRVGSICAADYAPFFDEAVSVIDTACNQFEPPG